MSEATDRRAVATVKLENDSVRVTEWRFAPRSSTGHHRHQYPYVVVPFTTCQLLAVGSGGDSQVTRLVVGEPYYRPAGVEHDVRNPNDFEVVFIDIELKGQ